MTEPSAVASREKARPAHRTRSAAARIFAGAAAACIAACAIPALASPARIQSARSGPRAFFGVGPASKTKVDGRSYFNWSATPGDKLIDHVAIVNFGTTAVTLRVYVTNAVSTVKGGTGFAPQGKAKGGPADWVTIHFPGNSPIVHLKPRSKIILPVTIIVPKNAPPGDHEGAIVASLTSVIQSKNHAKVHLVQQVADRIIARISGTLRPGLSVVGLHVTYHDSLNPLATGITTLTFRVRNIGNELLGGKVTVSVHGLLGSTETGPAVLKVPIMLPGASVPERVQISGVYPEFVMSARISVAPLVVTGQFDQGLMTYTGQVGFWAVPWILVIIIVVLVLLAVGIWLRRRSRRSAGPAAQGRALGGREKVEAS
jgi:hypothetical protein